MSKTLTVSDETYDLIKDQLDESEQVDVNDYQDFVGKKLFIRTVTYHLTGKVVKIIGQFMELKDAAYIASDGRFTQAIDDGELDEIEPVKVQVWVNINSITDIYLWKHKLPRKQK